MNDTLYVLDGYSVIYRSYFAFIRNPLRNPRGENSSAVFGFVRTLFSLIKDYEPAYFVVAMDSRVPTFRHESYPEYKATRDKTPDDLHAQIPVIEAILERLQVPVVRVERYEADDIMATLATRCSAEGRSCRIISGDKDLLQLVAEPVRVLRPGKNGIEELDREAVYRDWQVWPEQILDYLSLIGDASDNVPGVKGIGAKTAAKLLDEFGTLEELYNRLDEVTSASQRTKLAEGRESAWLSRKLITLATDAPVDGDLSMFAVGTLNVEAAAPLLLEQGMRQQLVEMGVDPDRVAGGGGGAVGAVSAESAGGASEGDAQGTGASGAVARRAVAARGGAAAPGVAASSDGTRLFPTMVPAERTRAVCTAEEVARLADTSPRDQYACVTTVTELDEWIERARTAGVFAFDSETTDLDAMNAEPVGFSLAVGYGEACYIPLVAPDGEVFPAETVRSRLKPLLTDPSCTLIAQNLKYDWKVLSRWGIDISCRMVDTMIAAWLVDTASGSYGMDRLAADYLGYETIHYRDLSSQYFREVPLEEATRYAAEDADVTWRLWRVLEPLLDKREVRELFEETEMPVVPLLARMELEGIGLDVFELERYSGFLGEEIERTEREIFDLVGHEFNIGSTKQLQQVLFEERKLKPVKKTKTGYSTDNAVMQELAREDPVPERVLRYRQLSKLRSTYVDALPRMVNSRTGRIHTTFNQTGTATGRLSSTDPNLQNIPIRDEEGRRIRSAFIPAEGKIFVSADYAQIELVILAHLSGDAALSQAFREGEDVHRRTASLIFGVDAAEVSSEQRRIAKTINFGVMYGMSAFRLSNELGISRKDADAFITAYFGTYNGIRTFIDETVARAEVAGEVRTLLGRPRPLPDITSRNRTVKAGVERVAVNTPIQGSGADIVKRAMIGVDAALREKGLASRLILQVHDELILECPQSEADQVAAIVMEAMTTAVTLSVPLRVNVERGERWGDMHA